MDSMSMYFWPCTFLNFLSEVKVKCHLHRNTYTPSVSLGLSLCLPLLSAQTESVCSASLHTHQYFRDTLTHSSLDETSLGRNLLLFSLSLSLTQQYLLIRLFSIPLCLSVSLFHLTIWCFSKVVNQKFGRAMR